MSDIRSLRCPANILARRVVALAATIAVVVLLGGDRRPLCPLGSAFGLTMADERQPADSAPAHSPSLPRDVDGLSEFLDDNNIESVTLRITHHITGRSIRPRAAEDVIEITSGDPIVLERVNVGFRNSKRLAAPARRSNSQEHLPRNSVGTLEIGTSKGRLTLELDFGFVIRSGEPDPRPPRDSSQRIFSWSLTQVIEGLLATQGQGHALTKERLDYLSGARLQEYERQRYYTATSK